MSQNSEFSDSEQYPQSFSDRDTDSQVSVKNGHLIIQIPEESKEQEVFKVSNTKARRILEDDEISVILSQSDKNRGTRRKHKRINYKEEELDDEFSQQSSLISEDYSQAEVEKETPRRGRPSLRGRCGSKRGRPKAEPKERVARVKTVDRRRKPDSKQATPVDDMLDFHHEICYE
jgi:hypothetical protein